MDLVRRVLSYLRTGVAWRQMVAYLLMACFVVLPTIGAWMVYPPAGWITGGVLSGIVGYVLGSD